MAETSVIDGALMTIRTARSRHRCGTPYPEGHWIEPGEQYEDWCVPPWRGGNECSTWWRGKRHAGSADSIVCDEIEAYREKAAREAGGDCTRTAIVGTDRYQCRSHEDGVHHFAMHWPACPAPFCKLPPDHRGLHDIPFGKAEYVNA